jgi:UDP-glucuronate 4-epimerase
MARIVVTGAAGFIGYHLAKLLLSQDHTVIGIDAFTPYYDVALKRSRAGNLLQSQHFAMHEFAIEDAGALHRAIDEVRPDIIVHLAAQAGVRYSLENPRAYIDSNLIGTFNILEAARELKPRHLMIASTSSVYGANTKIPFAETDRTDHPMTLYAATKKSCEAMAHSYSHLWNIPTTVFRFFSVYGPWGRPDMALFIFTKRILEGVPIDVYNYGNMRRDFTYVDDLVGAIAELTGKVPGDPRDAAPEADLVELGSEVAPFRLLNIGRSSPVDLLEFIGHIEKCVGRPAIINMMGMQPGDVAQTFADTTALKRVTGIELTTPVDVGVRRFVDWYRSYYRA